MLAGFKNIFNTIFKSIIVKAKATKTADILLCFFSKNLNLTFWHQVFIYKI